MRAVEINSRFEAIFAFEETLIIDSRKAAKMNTKDARTSAQLRSERSGIGVLTGNKVEKNCRCTSVRRNRS
jgi:hypothetical protein